MESEKRGVKGGNRDKVEMDELLKLKPAKLFFGWIALLRSLPTQAAHLHITNIQTAVFLTLYVPP